METTTKIAFGCPDPTWLVALCAVAMLVVACVFVVRDVRRIRGKAAGAIFILMFISALMVAGIMLNPTVVRTRPDQEQTRCVLLVDGTLSMGLNDTYHDQTAAWLSEQLAAEGEAAPRDLELSREEIVRMLLDKEPGDWLTAIRQDFDVVARRIGADLAELPLDEKPFPFQLDPDGTVTALGDQMKEAAGGMSGVPVVLISEGAWNTGADPADVARALERRQNPVYVIGVGDPEPKKDIAVLRLEGPDEPLFGDEVIMKADVAATGLGRVSLTVELTEDGGSVLDPEGMPLPPQDIVAPASGHPVTVTFSFMPKSPGTHVYTARVTPQADEVDPTNNSIDSTLNIVQRKIRVLLIDTEPRWEFRFIRTVLERDPAIELKLYLSRPGLGPISGSEFVSALPTDKKELLDYDLVILGDITRREIAEAFLENLADRLQHTSGALIVVAGRRGHFRELIGSPIADLLPVGLESDFLGGTSSARPFRAKLTQEGLSHLATRLDADPEFNENIWDRLPELYWAASVGELKRGAVSLLAHPTRYAGTTKMPLVAVHSVGAGKVMFCGIEGTWRWRKAVGDKYHYRYWAQLVRWLVKKRYDDDGSLVQIHVSQPECEVGESIEVEAYCLTREGYPLDDANVELRIKGPDDRVERIPMKAAPGSWGLYRATFRPTRHGSFEMQPIVAEYGPEPQPTRLLVDVIRPDLERYNLSQDIASLKAIAKASDGEYLNMERIGELPALLAARFRERALQTEYSPCRKWGFYTALALLLSSAWLIRKRSGLA